MAHHGDGGPPDWMKERIAEMFGQPLGKTGLFPQGKLTPSDEGGIRFAVGHRDGKVVIDFGTQVTWFGMGPDQADGLADLIKKHAAEAREQSK